MKSPNSSGKGHRSSESVHPTICNTTNIICSVSFIVIGPRKIGLLRKIDILKTTLSGGKSDIKKKDYSLSLLNVRKNHTCDEMRRMSGNREAVIC